MTSKRLKLLAGAGLAAAALGGAAYWFVATPRPGAAWRGAQLARAKGCVACHGEGGVGGIANPNSLEKEVPAFTGGTAMMYVESEAEIREWILDGRPKRLDKSPAGDKATVAMPAYRGHLSDSEVDDLVAWYRAAGWYDPDITDAAADGRRIASRKGCFGCHGAAGRTGAGNPGSFKGYIPGWGSEDFKELVTNEAELREWITDGVSARFKDNSLAEYFRGRQMVKMPAYAKVLKPKELDAIVAYINWLDTLDL